MSTGRSGPWPACTCDSEMHEQLGGIFATLSCVALRFFRPPANDVRRIYAVSVLLIIVSATVEGDGIVFGRLV